jgi:hypothetical protein
MDGIDDRVDTHRPDQRGFDIYAVLAEEALVQVGYRDEHFVDADVDTDNDGGLGLESETHRWSPGAARCHWFDALHPSAVMQFVHAAQDGRAGQLGGLREFGERQCATPA